MDQCSKNEIKENDHINSPATIIASDREENEVDSMGNLVFPNKDKEMRQTIMRSQSNNHNKNHKMDEDQDDGNGDGDGNNDTSSTSSSKHHDVVTASSESSTGILLIGKIFIIKFFQDVFRIFLLSLLFMLLLFSTKVDDCPSVSTTTTTSTITTLPSPSLLLVNGNKNNLRGSFNTVWGLSSNDELHLALVSDLDRLSLVSEGKSPTWKSYFKRARLIPTMTMSSSLSKDNGKNNEQLYDIKWEMDIELHSRVGESGRGMELSELVTFQNKLYAFDDRTGIAFEVEERTNLAIPRYIMMEGHGSTDKGQKSEWATVKDDILYVGSYGKEFTYDDGSIMNSWNLWVSKIDKNGEVTHEDWTSRYNLLREATNSKYPGYMIHEAIHWDEVRRQWIVLPRRISNEKYDEKLDERKGSNLMIVVNEDFTKIIKMIQVGPHIDLRGWASFKFIPGTNNELIIGLRTEEEENKDTGESSQRTFINIFRYEDGKEILPQTLIPGDRKYEGLEFL